MEENIIFKRRSIRQYDERDIDDERIKLLLKAGMSAPTAMNQREWEFVVVKNKEMMEKLSEVTPYTAPAGRGNIVIVPLVNKDLLKCPEYWQQDLGACVENILLEAVDINLAACWMGIAPNEDRMIEVSKLLSLPENVMPFCLISVGCYTDNGSSRKDRYEELKVHYEKY